MLKRTSSQPHGHLPLEGEVALAPDAFLSPLEIDAAVERALAEDLGRAAW